MSAHDVLEADRKHVWHPFTQMQEWMAESPLVIDRGEGNYLVDVAGRRYFDGVSSLWTNVHGHRRPELDAAIRAQLGKIAHSTLLGLAHEGAACLAERLAALAPGALSRVFYSDSGSTAVEVALKIAFQWWQHRGERQRVKFVSLAEAYHGDTLGAVAVGGIDVFHGIFGPLLFKTFQFDTPHAYRHPAGPSVSAVRDACLRDLDRVLAEHAGEVAAVIVEPRVQGAAGMLVQPDGFLSGVAERCRAAGVLLIADEVATGFGRTGTMFACEQEGVTPDLLCVAKGITGGYLPLAATLATEELFSGFLASPAEGRQFFHGHTYTGNPLACAAALASLDIFERDQVIAAMPGKIERLRTELSRLAERPSVGDVRQCGFMVGIELVASRESKERFSPSERIGARVCAAVRDHGVVLRPLGDVVVLVPPLSSTEEELAMLVTAVEAGLVDVGL